MGRKDAVRLVGSQLRPEVIDRDEEDIHRLRRRVGVRGSDSEDQA